MITLNQILHKLYSVNNEMENGNVKEADKGIGELIDLFESQLGYAQDSFGDLRNEKDKRILFCPKLEQG